MGRGERGSVTVWMVLIVMVLTMVIGIAVDLSGQVNAKRRAGDVAAQAARELRASRSAWTRIWLMVAASSWRSRRPRRRRWTTSRLLA